MEKALEVLRDTVLSWQLTCVVLLASTLTLFAPLSWASEIGIQSLRAEFRPWIGAGFLITLAALAVHLSTVVRQSVAASSSRSVVLRRIQHLSDLEREIMAFCLIRNQQSVNVPLYDDAAKALVQKGLLLPAGGNGNGLIWAHTVCDFVWEYLRGSPEMIMRRAELEAAPTQQWFQRLDAGQTNHWAFDSRW